MNKYLLFILTSFLTIFGAAAQKDNHAPDKKKMFKEVQEFKMKFLAQEMELKPNQQKQFFELYGEMNKKKRDCYKDVDELKKKLKSTPEATEEDYKKLREEENKANEKAAAIEKEYDEKFSEFLTEKQIFKMKEAETEFRHKMQEMRRARPAKGKVGKLSHFKSEHSGIIETES